MRMISRLLLSLVLACSLIACSSPEKKKQEAEAAKAKLAAEDADENGSDPNFLAFIGRLRKAVAQHDVNMLAPMMTANFGYFRLRKGDYSDEGRREIADRVRALLDGGRDAYVYFKHEDDPRGALWAEELRQAVLQPPPRQP